MHVAGNQRRVIYSRSALFPNLPEGEGGGIFLPMPSDAERFASMVGALRSSGLTLRAIGRQAGLSPATVWRMAEGASKQPSYDTIKRLEKAWERAGKPVRKG